MLRRSLIVLVAAVLVSLLFTLIWAFTLSGPATKIADAEAAMQARHYAEAVRILDTTERSPRLRDHPDLRAKMLRLRYLAHKELDAPGRALADLEALIALQPKPDDDLRLDRIWLLARTNDGPAALLAAKAFLADHPEHGRALELAGEACQAGYRDRLQRVAAQVLRDLVGDSQVVGKRAMLEFLYRPEGDPGVAAGHRALARIYGQTASLQQAWTGLEPELLDLRGRVQEGLDFHSRSLEAGGQPVAAWRGLSFALEQADRDDDVIALAEIYMARFDHVYVAEAAATAAAVHLRSGRPQAAVNVLHRYLPEATWRERVAKNHLDWHVRDLLLTSAMALRQLDDKNGLRDLAALTKAMIAAGLWLPLPEHFVPALALATNGDLAGAAPHLAAAASLLAQEQPPLAGDDPLDLVMSLRLDAMAAAGAKDQPYVTLFADWERARGRQGRLAPIVARTRYELRTDKNSAALASAVDASQRAPQDEAALQLLAEAAAANYRPSGQDGDGLLQQCVRRKVTLPEAPHDVCFLLCAESALRAGMPAIARDCARRATDRFSWSRWPRLLEARADLAADDPLEAARVLEKLIGLHPADGEAVSLLLAARQAANLPPDDRLFDALRCAPPSPAITAALLRSILAVGDAGAALVCATRAEASTPADATVLALVARAFALANDLPHATANLQRAASLLGDDAALTARAGVALAIAAVMAIDTTSTDDQLQQAARHWQPLLGVGGEDTARALLTAARALETAQRPRAAESLCAMALSLPDAVAARDGSAYLLAGSLCLQIGELRRAEQHLAAAVSFADGAAAAEPLARLLLLREHDDRARSAFTLAAEPADAALAMRLATPALAQRLLRTALQRDPDDLLLHCTAPLVNQVAPSAFGSELRNLPAAAQQRLLLLLALLADGRMAAAAEPIARELQAVAKDSLALQLLLARSLLDADKPGPAAAVHEQLFAAGVRAPEFFVEAVRSLRVRRGYLMPLPLRDELRRRSRDASDPLPAEVNAFAVTDRAHEQSLAGDQAASVATLAALWLAEPRASHVGVEQGMFLLRSGRPQDALQLLVALRPSLTGESLQACSSALFAIADALAAGGDAAVADLGQRAATAVLANGGVFGPALHFLLNEGSRRGAAASLPEDQQLDLLRRHLQACGAGAESAAMALRSLQELQRRAGSPAALSAAEALLRQRPTALPVWLWRARELLASENDRRGLDELRSLLAYAQDPELQLAAVTLAACQGEQQAADAARLLALPPALLRSPRAALPRGLLRLRAGDAPGAVGELLQAAPTADGAHLYFAAVALLQRGATGDLAAAEQRFAQLARDYPSSSLARYAGNFARQLAGR